MIKKSLLLLSIASATQAMQTLDDESLSVVSGQVGITVNYISNDAAGKIMEIDEVRLTENDRANQGDDYIALQGVTLSNYLSDVNGDYLSNDDFDTTFDVDSGGNARIRTSGLDGLHLKINDIVLSGRTIGGLEINVFDMVAGSYLESVFFNKPTGAEIGLNSKLLEGTTLNFKYLEDYALSADVIFKGSTAQTEKAFISELSLSADEAGVKLLIGNTEGSVELTNIILRDENTDTDLLGGLSYGDIGIGDITVVPGSYISAAANSTTATSEGLIGKINFQGTVGEMFYRTNGYQVNFKDLYLSTNGDIGYTLDQVSMNYVNGQQLTGIRSTISDVNDIDLIVNGVTFSAEDGSGESQSLGVFGVENLSFNGGTLNWDMYTLPGSGSKGLLMDINFPDSTSFDLTIVGDVAEDKLSASVVVNNLTIQNTVDIIPEGLHVGVMHMSADINLNNLTAGNGQTYQGSVGRMVVNNMSMRPGSYMRVAPVAP